MKDIIVVHKKSKKIAIAIHVLKKSGEKKEKVILVFDNLLFTGKGEEFSNTKQLKTKYDYYK